MRPILGEIVSIHQIAFVTGRLITDNALVAFEFLHFIEHNPNTSKDFCAYKLDQSKACDRVDWDFLKKVMQMIGFSHWWVDLIISCVTSVIYKVKFNGNLLDVFLLLGASDKVILSLHSYSCLLRMGCPHFLQNVVDSHTLTLSKFAGVHPGYPTFYLHMTAFLFQSTGGTSAESSRGARHLC
jgi:hypothetical protein